MAQTDLMVSLPEYDRQAWQMKLWELLRLQTEVGKEWNIKSPSIAFSKVLELAAEKLAEIREEKENDLGDSK